MKRLLSLTMAAACAMSLAVPAFAAVDTNDTGKTTTTPISEKEDYGKSYDVNKMQSTGVVTVTYDSETGEMETATSNMSVTLDGRAITVRPEGRSPRKQAQELAKRIEAVDGWDAEIIFGGSKEWWSQLKGRVTETYDASARQGSIEVVAHKTIVDRDTVLPNDIDDLTLQQVFLGWSEYRQDVLAFYESDVGNNDYGVLPNKTIYFVLDGAFYKTSDVEFDLSKAEGSKYIKSIKDVQKSFSDTDLYSVIAKDGVPEMTLPKGRYRVLEVKLKENMTDDEYKLLFDLRVKVKNNDFQTGWKKGDTKKFEDFGETWVSNDTWVGDSDWAAGTGGVMIKPQKNEDNEIIWYDENRDIAKLEFYADSDVDKFFVKLSTKWNNEWYSDMFRNTDAFIFNFVGAPKISATSRATLTIYNPFVNEDEELEVDLDELKVYKVLDTAALAATTEEAIAEAIADGRIEDVTNLFTAGENEDGDQVLTTRTRDLGTYIVTTATPADLVDDVVVDSTNNGKVNPGTGR